MKRPKRDFVIKEADFVEEADANPFACMHFNSKFKWRVLYWDSRASRKTAVTVWEKRVLFPDGRRMAAARPVLVRKLAGVPNVFRTRTPGT